MTMRMSRTANALTWEVECEVCGRVLGGQREKQPNERLPDFVLPPGWTQNKDGELCPEHSVTPV